MHTLAAGFDDSSIKLFDLRAVAKVQKLKESNDFEGVQEVAFSNSGRLLFAAYKNTKLKVWDTFTGLKAQQIDGYHKKTLNSISLSCDGATLASVGKDGVINTFQ